MTPSGPVSKSEIDEMDEADGLGPFNTWPFDGPDTWMSDEETDPILPPAPREPERRTIQSADPDLRICVHELARALEQYARKQYVPLYQGTAEFETAAIDMTEFILDERCQLKGR